MVSTCQPSVQLIQVDLQDFSWTMTNAEVLRKALDEVTEGMGVDYVYDDTYRIPSASPTPNPTRKETKETTIDDVTNLVMYIASGGATLTSVLGWLVYHFKICSQHASKRAGMNQFTGLPSLRIVTY